MEAAFAKRELEKLGLSGYELVRVSHNATFLHQDKTTMIKVFGDIARAQKEKDLLDNLQKHQVKVRNALAWPKPHIGIFPVLDNTKEPNWESVGVSLSKMHTLTSLGKDFNFAWEELIKSAKEEIAALSLASLYDQHLADAMLKDLYIKHKWFLSLSKRTPKSLVHADMTRSNLLCGADTYLIDFEMARLGPKEWDLGSLFFTKKRLGQLSKKDWRMLISSYEANGAEIDPALLRVCYLLWEVRYVAWILRKSKGEDKELLALWRKACVSMFQEDAQSWEALVPLLKPFHS